MLPSPKASATNITQEPPPNDNTQVSSIVTHTAADNNLSLSSSTTSPAISTSSSIRSTTSDNEQQQSDINSITTTSNQFQNLQYQLEQYNEKMDKIQSTLNDFFILYKSLSQKLLSLDLMIHALPKDNDDNEWFYGCFNVYSTWIEFKFNGYRDYKNVRWQDKLSIFGMSSSIHSDSDDYTFKRFMEWFHLDGITHWFYPEDVAFDYNTFILLDGRNHCFRNPDPKEWNWLSVDDRHERLICCETIIRR